MLPMCKSLFFVASLLLLTATSRAALVSTSTSKAKQPPQQLGHLTTSAGASGIRQQQLQNLKQQEKRLEERVKDEIRVASQKFVQGNEQVGLKPAPGPSATSDHFALPTLPHSAQLCPPQCPSACP